MSRWDNRIIAYEAAVDPEQLLANPANWRCHPRVQSDAMVAALDEVGWIDAVIVNDVTGHVVDGHLRVGEAITAGESVPVLHVELSEDDEAKALATFDTITGLATPDRDALGRLHAKVTYASATLKAVVASQLAPAATADEHTTADTPEPATAALTWGYVQWGRKAKVDSSEAEITAFDALYRTYVAANGNDVGFIRWVVDGQPADGETR